MNLLFIQGGSRLKLSDKGLWYTDPNFTHEVWERYLSFCEQLTIVLRREKTVYEDSFAKERFNAIPQTSRITIIPLEDLMIPITNVINPFMRARIKKVIYNAVKSVDKVIIRSTSEYTYFCYQACKRLDKEYMFEVTGFAYEGLYYQGFKGKVIANRNENWQKRIAWDSACALYVTNNALQRRYPSQGQMLGCSDVTLEDCDEDVLARRLKRIESQNKKIILGTCGRIADKNKGQHLVIKALALLKERGLVNFEYQLVGFGNQKSLSKLAAKHCVSESLKFVGGLPHTEINNWLDNVDIYIQPSYSEGLSRAILEAMSRACPVIASVAGGNPELISQEYIFKRGDYNRLANQIAGIICNLKEQAIRNFEFSKAFSKESLDRKRGDFIRSFMDRP